ncbi:MAG: transglycosylase domain-containing protein [Oscillospiraceae bacterium]|nr:transglycosylase domain-containing protein [Oscillospiraceae bacterium]
MINQYNQRYHNLRQSPLKKPDDLKRGKKKKLTPGEGAKYVFSVIGTTFLTLFLIIVITSCVVAVALSVYITQFADSMYDVDLKGDYELSYSSFVLAYDKEADKYTELLQLSADENRIWVDLEDIPQHTQDALVSTEDKRYYEHAGVDWTRTVGATMSEVFSIGEARGGGSTITQQLVRDITGDTAVNVGRKLREIFRSMSLEQKYSKHDIIESYLNRVAFGNTVYGVGSAAWHYFGKEVGELTVAESAILVGLLPSPVSWNPYSNPERARVWQLNTLYNMQDQGLISYAQYEAARSEQVRFRRPISSQCRCPEGEPRCKGDYFGYIDERYEEYHGLQTEDDDEDLYYQDYDMAELVNDPFTWNEYEVRHNWYVDAALKELTADLAELKDIQYESAADLIKRGGYRIYLSMDMEMQDKIEELFKDPYLVRNPNMRYPAGTPARDTLQAAFVIMDTGGNVVACVGGLGDKPGNDVFNRATQAQRNIGSTIKPFGVYAPAIDMDKITYSTMLLDNPGLIDNPDNPNSKIPWPQNFEKYSTGEFFPAWYAVQKSTNTISARTVNIVGVNIIFNYLQEKLGISTLTDNHRAYSPLATGQMEMKLHELAGAYQIFGTGGVYYKPSFYEKVEDREGNPVLYKDKAGSQAIDPDTAWIVNRMMERVVQDPAGTGQNAKYGMGGVEVVGKTGTANDMSDLLFCGLTPDYVGALRVGYDDNREIDRNHARIIARIWGDVMSEVTPTDFPREFISESSVLVKPYCSKTGLLAGQLCPSSNIGYYRESNTPQRCSEDEIAFTIAFYRQEASPIYN